MRPIPFIPNYLINEHGEVFNTIFKNGSSYKTLDEPRKLKPVKNKKGYYRIPLWSNNQYRIWFVHQLVLLAFVGPCPEGFECAHLDGNPSNNHVENLKWVSRKENHSHKRIHGTMAEGERIATHKLKSNDVAEIKELSRNGHSAIQLAKRFGVSVTMIGYIRRGAWWKHVTPQT